MAARLRKSHQDDVRAKIQTDRLLAYMHAGVFGTKFQGKDVELTPVKVSAIKCLLDKRLPDLARTEVTGDDGGPVVVEIVRFAEGKASK